MISRLIRSWLVTMFVMICCVCPYLLMGQSLTVSSSGQTGTSGTNWSISGSTLTVTGTANIRASVIENVLTTGNLSVVGNSTNFAVTLSEAISSTTAGSSLTIGSMTNTGAITISSDISLAGGISIMGGDVQLNGNITSTATGDLFFQGLGNAWSIRLATGKTIEKTAGTGLLTMQGNGRINNSTSVGSIIASGTAQLDVVIINEMDEGTAGLYNVSTGNITTNGGDLWISAGAKTQVWNGLSVGSTGVPGNGTYNGIDVTGNISTNGGDILVWAFVGSAARTNGYGDITAITSNRTISSGSGDITLMTRYNDFVNSTPDISISTTGTLTFAPASGSSFDVALSFSGTTTSGTFTGSGGLDGLIIQNFTSLSSLVIGNYLGTGVSGDSPYSSANTADVTIASAVSIAGPISIYGGDILSQQNITSTLTGAPILLQATGTIALSASRTIQSNGGNITFRANSGGTGSSTAAITLNSGSSLLSQGGNITLGGNFTGAQGTGLYATGSSAPGVEIITATISAAGGNINIYGKCNSSYDDGIRLVGTINTTGTGTIALYGEAHGGNDGTNFFGGISFFQNPSTIETEDGNLTLSGLLTNTQSNSTGAINFYRSTGSSGQTRHINLLSKTGDITVLGDRGTTAAYGIGQSSWGNVYVGSPSGGSWTATGDVVFSYSSLVPAGFNGIVVNTTGDVTYQPTAASFAADQTFPANSNYVLATNAASLTIGKSGNTAGVTIGSNTSIAGPITLYAGTITLNANLTSTASGDISLYSDAALAGLSSARTITTSGAVKYMPNGTSFSSTVPFPITNLTLTNLTGLQLGKSGNTAGITIGAATSVNGYVTVFGGALALNFNLTTTNTTTGDISINGTSLSGTGNLVVAAGRTATVNVSSASTYDGIISGTGSGFTKAGAGVLTLTKDHTYTGATTISGGDLQVGTGGSVSQASSGTISRMNGSTQEGTSGVSVASGARLILTPNENIVFPASVLGDGGVEIKGASGKYWPAVSGWLSTTAVQLVTNTTVLEALTRITGGKMGGTAISSGPVTCGAYQKSYNAANNTATLQLQTFNGDATGTFTKCVFIKLTQSGANVMIQADNSFLSTGAGYKSGNVLGTNIASGGSSMTLATSGGTGYGISEVFMSGKVNFTGALTYTGNTVLSNTISSLSTTYNAYSYTSKGTQEITDASASFPGPIVNNGLVILNRTSPFTISGDMSGTEDVLQVGAAVTMTGTNTHSGTTTINLNKELNIGIGGTSGSLTGNIVNYGTVTFNRSDASSYPGILSGSGTLTKSGTGALTMTALNTYTGATTISVGSLILERDVPATSSTGFSGAGTLVIQPASTSFTNAVSYPISGFNVHSTIGGLQLGKSGNTQNISFASATQASGPITVYGGTVTLAADLTTNTSGDISIYSDNTLTITGTRIATAAGMFKYMPNGTSFTNAVSYPVGSLTVNSNGLQLGKPGNTAALTITGASSSNGPVSVFTGNFTTAVSATLTATSSALEVTASGNVTLNAALAGSSTTVNVQGNLQTIGTLTNVNLTGGNAQGITGTATLKNLTLNKASGTATLTDGRQDVTDVLTLTSGTLAAGGYLTLKSSATGTARMAQIPATGASITGNVTVERHIPASRKWRMLTAPVTGSSNNSIFYNWQNNGGTTGNNGVDIWGPGGSADPAAGNGLQTGPNPSMRSYNGGWQNVTDTKNSALFDASTNNAYTVFVTGPFKNGSVTVSTSTAAVATTLSATGNLIIGTHTKTLAASPAAGQFFLVGNPYAAPLYVKDISGNNLSGTFYMWDAAEAGNNQLGKYVGFDRTSGLYTLTTNGFPDSSTRVQSGQAFFVKADQASVNTTITFEEADKALTSSNGMFGQSILTQYGMLRMTLQYESMGNRYNADGAVALFYANGNPAIDRLDGTKLMNSGENLFMRRSHTSLMFEHRAEIQTTDTVFLRMSNMQQQSYRLQLEAKDLGVKEAYLIDPYTKKQIPVTLNGTTDIDFSVTSDSASTGDRFMVVFSRAAAPVVVTPDVPVSTKSLTLYPNPVRGKLHVSVNLSEAGPYSVKVYNAGGGAVWQRSGIASGTKTVEINTSGMVNGIYHLVLTDAEGGTIVEKFVKE